MIVLLTALILSISGSDRFFDSGHFTDWWQGAVGTECPGDRKGEYRNFIEQMRLKRDPEQAFRYFTGAKLNFYSQKVSRKNFKNRVMEAYEETLKLEDCFKKDDDPNVDYFLAGNVPYHLGAYKNTQLLRIPNVTTIHNEITEEFLDYLQALKIKSKTHLYINVMSKLSGVQEQEKIEAVHQLEDETLTVITLDKNSPFYWQTGEWEAFDSASEWKAHFATRLLSQTKTNGWSPKLKNAFWKWKIDAIIDNIHKNYFNSNPILSQNVRLKFIELVYLRLTQSLIEELQPDYTSISCKQSIDRAPTLAALLLVDQKNPDFKKALGVLIWQPVFLRNRPAHLNRLERFLQAYDALEAGSHSP